MPPKKETKQESDSDSSEGGGLTSKAPPLRRDGVRATSSMDNKNSKNENDKITYDINEGVQPHEIISQNIQKFFKYNEKNLIRPQVIVDSAEQTKARTWVFFLIVIQLIVCVGYGFVIFYVPSDIVWWIHAACLIFYFGLKILFIVIYNLKRLFTCTVCSSKFDPETMSQFEEIFICVSVFNESKSALENLVSSIYSANYTKHKMYMVFVVDGNKNNTFQSLMEVLEGTPFTERIQNGKPFTKHGVCHGICYSVYLKESNRGKRDSQWVFIELVRNIFPEHKPPYIAFLDSDCSVHPDAFRYMVDKFKHDKDIAGVCGSIKISNLALKGQAVDNAIFRLSTLIIVGMQYYEYCWNAVFSKQFEAATNSLTGMHGQFSMYRTDVLTNIDAKVNPQPPPEMDETLKSLALPTDRSSVSFFYVSKVKKTAPLITQDFFSKPTIGLIDRNLYDLGSERTLARRLLELKYKTVYEPRAVCWTEVPDSISKFLHRRRRWLNAAFMNQVMMFFKGSLWCQPRMWAILILTLFEIIGAYILPTIGVVVLYQVWGYMLKEVDVSISLVLFVWIIVQVLVIASTKMETSDMFYVISCFVSGLMMATAAYFFVRFTVIEVVKYTIYNDIGLWQRTVVYLIFPAMHIFVSISHPLAFFAAIANYFLFPTIAITAPLYAFFHLDDFSWSSR